MSTSKTIHFIHISDTHIGSSPDFELYGKNTFECTRELVSKINSYNAPVDFILHTGDVVNHPDPLSYELALKLFKDCKPPIIYVPGNHDDTEIIKTLGRRFPGVEETSSYKSSSEFELGGCRFCILDCKGPPEIDPHGIFNEAQKNTLKTFLDRPSASPAVIFLHFPPVSMEVPWIDRDMLILNGESLHRLLKKYQNIIAAVFFGHLHRRISLIKDGIFYSSAPSPFCQFSISPFDQEVTFEPDIPVSFNYVTIKNKSVLIKEISG